MIKLLLMHLRLFLYCSSALLCGCKTYGLQKSISFVESLLTVKNYDIYLFSDRKLPQKIYHHYMDFKKTHNKSPISFGYKQLMTKNCTDSAEIKYDLDSHKKPKLIVLDFSNESSLNNFLNKMEETIITCPLVIEPGLFHLNNVILYLNGDYNGEEMLKAKKEIQRHPQVISLNENKSNLYVKHLNPCTKIWKGIAIWKSHKDTNRIYPLLQLTSLKKCHLRVGCMPYDYYAYADLVTNPPSPNHLWTNYQGTDVKIMETLCSVHGCSLSYRNPKDQEWGRIRNGKFTGTIQELIKNNIDIMACGVVISLNRVRVSIIMPIL